MKTENKGNFNFLSIQKYDVYPTIKLDIRKII